MTYYSMPTTINRHVVDLIDRLIFGKYWEGFTLIFKCMF
jgi:hypothetical protein